MGILRTPMEGGYSRQRRLYDVMPHVWAIEFEVKVAQLYDWQNWINQYAYDFFKMPLISWLSSQAGTKTSLHVVRFISNLEVELVIDTTVTVRVSVEASPSQV